MLEFSASIEQKNRFFSSGRYASFRVELRSIDTETQISLPEFMESLLKHTSKVLPLNEIEEVRENGKITYLLEDLRGRPKESFQISDPGYQHIVEEQRKEELFSSEGSIIEAPANFEDYPEEVLALNQLPFHYRLTTRFHSFSNNGHIIHQVIPQKSKIIEDIVPDLHPSNVLRLFPAKLDTIRMGYETYKNKFLGSMLGLVPDIETRMYLEATPKKVFIFAETEGLQDRDELPFEEQGLLSALDHALRENRLYDNFMENLRSRFA